MMRKLAAGNWKMNGTLADLAELDALASACADVACDILICPPSTLIHPMVARIVEAYDRRAAAAPHD